MKREFGGRALLALLAAASWMFREAVFQGGVFYQRDIQLAWQPQVSVFIHCLARGSWPVWDPFQAFGQPLLADPSAQLLYPPTWLNLVLMPWTYYTVFVIAHVVLGAAGVRALALRGGTSEAGAFVAGLLWMLSGSTMSLVNLYHHFAGAAWIPWVLLAADRAMRSGRLRDVNRLAIVGALQLLAGSAEMAVASALLVVFGAAVTIVDWRDPFGAAGRRLLRAAIGAGVLAVALACAQWLPTADAARRSQRAALDEEQRTRWSVHPIVAMQTIVPAALGPLPLKREWRADLFDGEAPFLASIYLGMPAVALVAMACVRRRWFWIAVAVGALLVALGRHTPVYGIVSTLLPFLRSFRYPAKAIPVVALGWAMLAGMGFDAWRDAAWGSRARWHWCAAGFGLLALAAAVVAAWFWVTPQQVADALLHQPDPYRRSLAVILREPRAATLMAAALTGAVAVMAVLRARRPALAGVLAPVVAVLAAVDLAAAHRNQNPTAPREMLASRPPVLGQVRQDDARRLYVYDYSGFAGKPEQHLGRSSPYLLAGVPPGFTADQARAWAARLYPVPPQPAI